MPLNNIAALMAPGQKRKLEPQTTGDTPKVL